MEPNEKIASLRFKLKVFGWYIITEPFRQLKDVFHYIIIIINLFNKALTWAYISLIMLGISLYEKNRAFATMFLLLLFFCVLLWEWQDGFFLKRYREVRDKKLHEKHKKEVENNGL